MFHDLTLYPALPASDLARARTWYQEKLDLKPHEEDDIGGMRYRAGDSEFLVYPSQFAGTNKATAAAFEVPDLDAAMTFLRDRGVQFQDFELPEMDIATDHGVLTAPDGTRAAWFNDSEGNIIGLAEARD